MSVPRTSLEELLVRDFSHSVHAMDAQALTDVMGRLVTGLTSQQPAAVPDPSRQEGRSPAGGVASSSAGPAAPAPAPPQAAARVASPKPEDAVASTADSGATASMRSSIEQARRDTREEAVARARSSAKATQFAPQQPNAQPPSPQAPPQQVPEQQALAGAAVSEPQASAASPRQASSKQAQEPSLPASRAGENGKSSSGTVPEPRSSIDADAQSAAPEAESDRTGQLLGIRSPGADAQAQSKTSTVQQVTAAAQALAGLPLAIWVSLDRVFPEALRPSSGALPLCMIIHRQAPHC